MNKYEHLEQKANEFLALLIQATEQATNNDDMQEIADIAQCMICKIPQTLITVDVIDRATVQSNANNPLPKGKLDRVMQMICDWNYCKANDDDVVADIMDAIDQVEAIENKG